MVRTPPVPKRSLARDTRGPCAWRNRKYGADEDLETFLDADALVEALDSTFRIVENCLDRWTLNSLNEEIHRTFGEEEWVGTRGSVIQGAFVHDIWHSAELNETLNALGLVPIDFWN